MGIFIEIKKIEQNQNKVIYEGIDNSSRVYFNIDVISKIVLICLDRGCNNIFQVIDVDDKDALVRRPLHISPDAYGRMIIKINKCIRENNYPDDISWQS